MTHRFQKNATIQQEREDKYQSSPAAAFAGRGRRGRWPPSSVCSSPRTSSSVARSPLPSPTRRLPTQPAPHKCSPMAPSKLYSAVAPPDKLKPRMLARTTYDHETSALTGGRSDRLEDNRIWAERRPVRRILGCHKRSGVSASRRASPSAWPIMPPWTARPTDRPINARGEGNLAQG